MKYPFISTLLTEIKIEGISEKLCWIKFWKNNIFNPLLQLKSPYLILTVADIVVCTFSLELGNQRQVEAPYWGSLSQKETKTLVVKRQRVFLLVSEKY